MAKLTLQNIKKSYDNQHYVLKNISLTVHDGELVSILGPSGCGKSTTLNIIAGLLKPTEGKVLVDNKDISGVPVRKRNFGMVFQDYALFPKMSVFDNVAFGLKQHHLNKSLIQKKVSHMLRVTKLSDLSSRYPRELSGGQQQRVSLARALVLNPKILLMDEPLSNLDARLRGQMSTEIRDLQKEFHTTTVYVTHNQRECFAISDRVAIIHNGMIEQVDTPQNIYKHPASKFVARFIGYHNIMPVKSSDRNNHYLVNQSWFNTKGIKSGKVPRFLTINPNRIQFKGGDISGSNVIKGSIVSRIYLGDQYQYIVKTSGDDLCVRHGANQIYKVHSLVNLYLPNDALIPLFK